jgi:hypothetical protein
MTVLTKSAAIHPTDQSVFKALMLHWIIVMVSLCKVQDVKAHREYRVCSSFALMITVLWDLTSCVFLYSLFKETVIKSERFHDDE